MHCLMSDSSTDCHMSWGTYFASWHLLVDVNIQELNISPPKCLHLCAYVVPIGFTRLCHLTCILLVVCLCADGLGIDVDDQGAGESMQSTFGGRMLSPSITQIRVVLRVSCERCSHNTTNHTNICHKPCMTWCQSMNEPLLHTRHPPRSAQQWARATQVGESSPNPQAPCIVHAIVRQDV